MVHPSHNHVPAYLDPRFAQTLPDDRAWTLMTPSNKVMDLLYRDDTTGEEVLVPSIWYNQPVAWRIQYLRNCAERSRRRAAVWRQSKDTWAPTMVADMEREAAELDATADTIPSRLNGTPGKHSELR
jgi:hypothetical protein